MVYQYQNKVEELNGLRVVNIDVDDEQLMLEVEDGRRFIFYHDQDCCESVRLYNSDGVNELKGRKLLRIDYDNVDDDDFVIDEYVESYTFTNVHFITDKDTVIVRWFGESNGYYSEGISFCEIQ